MLDFFLLCGFIIMLPLLGASIGTPRDWKIFILSTWVLVYLMLMRSEMPLFIAALLAFAANLTIFMGLKVHDKAHKIKH